MKNMDFSSRKNKPIVVVGSLNMDLVMRVPRVPVGGETLHGHGFSTLPGGKGANQAVACARLGAAVSMIGQVGDDGFGPSLIAGLITDGIDAEGVKRSATAGTGVAVILVEDAGQNRIMLDAGANGALTPADIDACAATIEGAAMLVLQLEIAMPAIERTVAIAHAAGVPVLLNPGPAVPLPETLWPLIDLLIPNESEAALLSGQRVDDLEDAKAAARSLRARGVGIVLITLGANGVLVADDEGMRHLPAKVVEAVDTTAAGDTFIGGLAAGLLEGLTLDAAAMLGQQASAVCVTRRGAQPSIPYRHELPITG